jgi:long-chain fatty acid transport protein
MNNPATLGLMGQGNRLDVAVGMLGPDVKATCVGCYEGADLSASSGGDAYYMPAIGWTKKDGALTYGVAMFAQGGMGTEYAGDTFMMKAVILAGGLGTRISEETAVRPKPMIEIGGKPRLWHLMKHYSFHGID